MVQIVPTTTGLEEAKVAAPIGHLVDAGVGLLRARLPLNTPYLVVAEGLPQAEALLAAGVPKVRIVALVGGLEEASRLTAAGLPGDNIFRADTLGGWDRAKKHVWRVAASWLEALEGVEVTVLKTTDRTVAGLLAQIKGILVQVGLEEYPITAEDAEQLIEMYRLGV